ncbi:MAG: non-canonical purine NTP pyrophosphatase [bacterium]|nr:non-canonical purine NTP pyrophosphatase [bacterium]
MKPRRILLITSNPGKAAEFSALLPGLELGHAALDLIEIQSLSAREIGRHKALEALGQLKPDLARRFDAVLTDDTSLAFNTFGGFPGPLVKYCLDALGPAGLADLVAEREDRSAQALCQLSLAVIATGEVFSFEGVVAGKIGAPQGSEGFGWDPIFFPEEAAGKSYAQLSADEKNQISHRRRAVEALREWLGR